MRLFPQGVYFRSHMVWFQNNMIKSQNDSSDFRNNMQENGKEHKRKYPVFPTWQSVISEICKFVSKQHVKVIGLKSTLNNMPNFRLISKPHVRISIPRTKNWKIDSNSQWWFSKRHELFLNLHESFSNLHGVRIFLSSWLKYGKIAVTCVGINMKKLSFRVEATG
jgi:hypothetical protein